MRCQEREQVKQAVVHTHEGTPLSDRHQQTPQTPRMTGMNPERATPSVGLRGYMRRESSRVTFWKRQNLGNRERIGCCWGPGAGEGQGGEF